MEFRNASDGVFKNFMKDVRGKIRPEQWGIYSKTGTGKSLAEEGLVEAYFDAGFSCIYLGDGMKGEEEGAYAMFEPREYYHLRLLKLEGKKPRKVPVILYHPFTFNLPKNQIPNYNIFTIPIKNLNRREFSMLSETQADSDTIRILMQSCQNLTKSGGIYQLLHDVQNMIKGKRYRDNVSPSSDNFYLSVTSGTAKSMQDISNLFQPFKRDYFLCNENCKYNLDFQKILTDNKSIHFFSTKYLRDPKMKEFILLLILNKIIENKEYAKYPVCIIIPEIRKLCPDRSQGYQKFLSDAIKESLSTMRNIGKGFASILSSQSWNDTDKGIVDSHSVILLGSLNLNDIDKISKIRGYDKEIRNELSAPSYKNSWFVLGNEGYERMHYCLPSWGHAEPEYKFENEFRKEYSEKMISAVSIIQDMEKQFFDEEIKFREKIRREEEAERLRQKRKKEEKLAKKEPDSKAELRKLKEQEKLKDYERAYNMRQEGLTLEDIGKKLNTNKESIRRWIKRYEKSLLGDNYKNAGDIESE